MTTLIEEELANFSSHITRIEVHLADENSQKRADNDKRCMLEARIENRKPIAVTSYANTVDQAASDALDKLKASLATIIGRLRNH